MKTLIISPYLPHPKSGHGGGTQLYGLLSQLSKRHELALLSFADKKERLLAEDLKALPIRVELVPREKRVQRNLPAVFFLALRRALQLMWSLIFWVPYGTGKFYSPKMARRIQSLTATEKFDIVQIEYAQMGNYVKFVQSGHTIWHDHDVALRHIYRHFKKLRSPIHKAVMQIEWRRWHHHYRKVVRQFDCILTVTDQDRKLLERCTGWNRICYLPAGVDVPSDFPSYETREDRSLLFVGSFPHRPNLDGALWLCKEIFPAVLREFPDAILYIIGPDPPASFQQISRRHPAIKVLGFVEDIQSYLQRCAVFIAPLRFGGGVKVKILHAMAQGIPVVTTRIGAEGIENLTKENILTANTAWGLTQHVCRLFSNKEFATTVGRKGYETVRSSYSWDSVLSRLETIYCNIVTNARC